MKVRFINWSRDNAELMEQRIKNSKKVVSYVSEENGFEFVVTFKRGTKFEEIAKIANGQTMVLA